MSQLEFAMWNTYFKVKAYYAETNAKRQEQQPQRIG